MNVCGILFDVNGTMIDILTDEGKEDVYRTIACFLAYQGVHIAWPMLREDYFRRMDAQRRKRGGSHPEFDAVGIWSELLEPYADTMPISKTKRAHLPRILAEMYRVLSRIHLGLYADVQGVLDQLAVRYRLGVVSDGQSAWALPELKETGIARYFDPIIVSGDFGYRKPDRRLFEAALHRMHLKAEQVIFVGNDMYRDVYGARRVGMKTVFFQSNQGRQEMEGVEPDYVIYRFRELLDAVSFLERNR
ncbi:MAG: HAD family hydrolase [Thermodesulfobacteriota bacterium]